MDIHKPKPWHGVREFLKEYAIIVVGVLTALAAEAGVEWLHWREKVELGEAQIRRELSFSWDYARERVEVTPCLERRLAMLEDRLLAPGTQWTPLPPMVHPTLGPAVLVTPGRSWGSEVWTSLTADGTIGHFDRDRQVRLGRIYSNIAYLDALNKAEKAEDGDLEVIGRPMELDRAQRIAFARVIARERTRVRDMGFIANQFYRGAPRFFRPTMEQTNTIMAESNTLKACRALGLPIAATN